MEVIAFDVFVRNYDDGKPMITLTVQGTLTIEKLKKQFTEQFSEVFYPEKQLYWHGGIALKRDYMTLNDYDIKPGDTLYVQDRGTQVSYRLSQILINIGPVITFLLFHVYRFQIYNICLKQSVNMSENFDPSYTQEIAFNMGLLHFVKRVFECIFVHFYSKPSKSLSNLVKDLGYYWLFFGLVIPFYLLHPNYKEDAFWKQWYLPTGSYHIIYQLLVAFFGFAEIMSLLCHMHLKSFRRGDHDYSRGIPRFHGFSAVSCANYFWEFLAWTAFALVAQTLMSFMFLVIAFIRMNYRAHRKHHRYIAEFKNLYPAEQRCYFIPYLF